MEIKITNDIKYIGVDDKNIDLFESQYIVPNGIAYNSYVILDDKITVMDTVDQNFADEWLNNLANVLNGKNPTYLIVQHLEPDHSGSIGKFMEVYPNTTIICSIKAKTMFNQFVDIDLEKIEAKKEGDTLELGDHTLTFINAPMVHWPEVMFSYDSKDKVLFSADAFGKFGALDTDEDWNCEARRYYFNIVGKYGAGVQTVLKKASNLDIKYICPLHGPVLSDTIPEVLSLYNTWSSYEPENKGVFIAYASIHGNTKKAALKMKEILQNKGCPKVAIADLSREDIAECVEDAFRHSTLLCMAPSYDAGVFAPMSDFLHHLQSKAFQNRTVALVENFSWAASGLKTMKNEFEKMKNINIIDKTVSIKTRLTNDNICELENLADIIIKELT